MSTGAECRFIEVEPGSWKYQLQRYPYGETEEYDTYGPFRSFAAALEHLGANHANPGGWSVNTHEQHVHEWETGEDYRPVGVQLSIRVDSLGPDATPADVIRYVQALPVDHPAWHSRPALGLVGGIKRCAACGEEPNP